MTITITVEEAQAKLAQVFTEKLGREVEVRLAIPFSTSTLDSIPGQINS